MGASISEASRPPLPAYAVHFLRAVPDAAVLLTARGRVLAANRKARLALHLADGLPAACDLASLVDDPAGDLPHTLRTWARTTEALPGSFVVVVDGRRAVFNGKGGVVVPEDDTTPALLLVRFWPRSEGNPFVLLNQKVAELHHEVSRRVQVEDALRRSEAALQERVNEAEALNRTKDEFLATVSHELRTPLNAILGWSALLRRGLADRQIHKAIEVIHRNAEAQARLVDDILDVSRIITGKMRLELRPADIVRLVEEAVEVVRPSAAAKLLDIRVQVPDRPCVLVADPDRIRQVVWNLLSNAVKFTERGGAIRVEVRPSGSQYEVHVADTGAGIDPDFLPLMFDRFRQADGSTTRRAGGLGLGLALVRSIVELHGGTVDAASAGLGRGARFVVTLPVRATTPATGEVPDVAAVPPPAVLDDPGALVGIRALVVDDERDARELLTAVLTSAGAVVETAATVADALEAVRRFRPHVLVSDIGMPDENGYSLLRRLRAWPPEEGGQTPAVALTAYTRDDDRQRAMAAGFTTHVGKPVHPDDLVGAVAAVVVATPGRG